MPTTTFACPECTFAIPTTPDLSGRRIACPECGHRFILPDVVQFLEPVSPGPTVIYPDANDPAPDDDDADDNTNGYSNSPPRSNSPRRRREPSSISLPPQPWFRIAVGVEIATAVFIVLWPCCFSAPARAIVRAFVRIALDSPEEIIVAFYYFMGVWTLILLIARGIVCGWIVADSNKRMQGTPLSWLVVVFVFGVWTVYVYLRYRRYADQ